MPEQGAGLTNSETRAGIRPLRDSADGMERVAAFDRCRPWFLEFGARWLVLMNEEADDKDGVRILRHIVTGRRKPCGFGREVQPSRTAGTVCSASVLTAIRFCFGRWIHEAVVCLDPLRQCDTGREPPSFVLTWMLPGIEVSGPHSELIESQRTPGPKPLSFLVRRQITHELPQRQLHLNGSMLLLHDRQDPPQAYAIILQEP